MLSPLATTGRKVQIPTLGTVRHMADPPLLAAGVVTAPQFVERRAALRSSWLRWPNVGPSRPIRAHFVLRSAHAPPKLEALLADEARKHGDLLRVEVAWNETRLRGPLIAVARWFEYALATYPSAPLIGKMDDDVYVHAPRLEQLLRAAIAGVARPDRLYLGSITYFNWFPKIFERSGFGWSYPMAHRCPRCPCAAVQAEALGQELSPSSFPGMARTARISRSPKHAARGVAAAPASALSLSPQATWLSSRLPWSSSFPTPL